MTESFTSAQLVAAFQGREGIGLMVVREAAGALEETIRQRVLDDANALGLDVDKLAAALDGRAPEPTTPKRTRAPATKPEAPEDDGALLRLLLTELDKGEPLTAKAMARRTGASTARVTFVLRETEASPANTQYRIALHGLKWSRRAP